MLKKIHSDRQPGVTLWTEIHREFAAYFDSAGTRLSVLLERRPRFGFSLMVTLLLLSAVLSFTLFRHPAPEMQKEVVQSSISAPLHEGIDQLLNATAAIRETVRLKHFIDSLATKEILSAKDSIALDTALSRLENLQKLITHH